MIVGQENYEIKLPAAFCGASFRTAKELELAAFMVGSFAISVIVVTGRLQILFLTRLVARRLGLHSQYKSTSGL
jgi:hypothetical protein